MRPLLLLAGLVGCDPKAGVDGTDTDLADADADTDADADADTDTDADADADSDTDTDAPNDTGAAGFLLSINEVLADPAAEAGDANCDGTTSTTDDEFVEVVNLGTVAVDLGGGSLSDDASTRHVFAEGTVLAPGSSIVVFGAGTPLFDGTAALAGSWCVALPPEAEVVVASTGALGLTNSGDVLTVSGPSGAALATATIGSDAGDDQSLNRSPDLTVGPFVRHTTLPGAAAAWSPGTRADGGPLSDVPVLPPPGDPTGAILHEVLYDAAEDANCDGDVDVSGDEFVEIYNPTAAPLDLSGSTLTDDAGTPRHVFAPGSTVGPGDAMVVFGGGAPTFDGVEPGGWCEPLADGVAVAVASTGMLGLSNGGDTLTLAASDGTVLDSFSWSAGFATAVSATRDPQASAGAWVQHTAVAGALWSQSPGRRADGTAFVAGGTGPIDTEDSGGVPPVDVVGLVLNEFLADAAVDGNCDAAIGNDDEFVELVNNGATDVVLGGATVADGFGVRHTFAPGTRLQPGEVLVLFAGGVPTFDGTSTSTEAWCVTWPSWVRAETASGGTLGLNNDGDTLTVTDAGGTVLVTVTWGAEGGDDQSLTRSPDLADAPFVQHASAPGTIGAASPGLRLDGSALGAEPPPDTGPTDTDTGVAPADANDTGADAVLVVINEVLADPGPFDANCDGVVDTSDDEFLELVNVGSVTADLGGATLQDALLVRHTFAGGTLLPPGATLVVFGAGAPDFVAPAVVEPWCVPLPPEVSVVTASTGTLALSNTGDAVTLVGPSGGTLATASWGGEGGDDTSLVLAPELFGTDRVQHDTVSPAPFSPGTRANGGALSAEPLDTGLPEDTSPPLDTSPPVDTAAEHTAEPPPDDTAPPPPPPQNDTADPGLDLVINEVLADPEGTADANCDGAPGGSDEEFVEFFNAGTVPVVLDGGGLTDNAGLLRHTFPEGTVLAPGEVLVLFADGDPWAAPGPEPWCIPLPVGVLTQVASSAALGLNNAGDNIVITGPLGASLASFGYGAEGNDDTSLLRDPEIVGDDFVQHLTVSPHPFSPGRDRNLEPLVVPPPAPEDSGHSALDTAPDTAADTAADTGIDSPADSETGEPPPSDSAESASPPADTAPPGDTAPPVDSTLAVDSAPPVDSGPPGDTAIPSDTEETADTSPPGDSEAPPPTNDTADPGLVVVINEVLADPGPFDANCDAVIDTVDDEFVEIVNVGSAPVYLGAVRDLIQDRHVFTPGAWLAPGEAVVVFGGGAPFSGGAEPWCAPPGVASGVASTGALGLTNTGDEITLIGPAGAVLATFVYGPEGGDDQSLTLDPELVGPAHLPHGDVAGTPMSPGTRRFGAPLAGPADDTAPPDDTSPPEHTAHTGHTADPFDTAETADTAPPSTANDTGAPDFALALNEVLADPGPLDANCDGAVDVADDEFVEFVNHGLVAVDLGGAVLLDGFATRHAFEEVAEIPPGGTLVLYGGGSPRSGGGEPWCALSTPDVVHVVASSGALGLTNGGDTLTLVGRDGGTLASMSYGAEGGLDQSLVLDPDVVGGSYALHGSVSPWACSPGLRADGDVLPGVLVEDTGAPAPANDTADPAFELVINEILADPGPLDGNCDGVADPSQDEFLELVNVGTLPATLHAVHDAFGPRHQFPFGTLLLPGEALVVFGGGAPFTAGLEPWCSPLPLGVGTATSSSGLLALNNDGDTLAVVGPLGQTLVAATYGPEAEADQSLTLDPELVPGLWVLHGAVSDRLASPGTRRFGAALGGPPVDSGLPADSGP